jgi:diacylglycerol kinase
VRGSLTTSPPVSGLRTWVKRQTHIINMITITSIIIINMTTMTTEGVNTAIEQSVQTLQPSDIHGFFRHAQRALDTV